MHLPPLPRWRSTLLFAHRWLGIVLGLLLLLWTVSGAILLYYGMPHFTAGERLARLEPLDLATARVEPAAALAQVEGVPRRLRVSMHDSRPVYRVNSGEGFGTWSMVYADTGELLRSLGQDDVIFAMVKLYPEYDETMGYERHLFAPDQFTHLPALQGHFPVHRLNMGNGDEYYVSERSGEIVMRTTYLSRVLGFFGYNLHTLGFWRQQAWWGPLLRGAGWLGLGLAVFGMLASVRHAPQAAAAPAAGRRLPWSEEFWLYWHHHTGLLFGAVLLTWLLSGLVALGALPGLRGLPPSAAQLAAGARTAEGQGAALDFTPLTLDALREAVGKIGAEFPVKELELQMVNGEPYYLAYRPPTPEEQANWASQSVLDALAPMLAWEHRYISATNVVARPFAAFGEADLLAMATAAMPGLVPGDPEWLTEPDAYYRPTLDSLAAALPVPVQRLPVLKLTYQDAERTWLYLEPSHAQLLKVDQGDRRQRWFLNGLHGLDLPLLRNYRPLWDSVVLLLLLGCVGLCLTAAQPAWQRLKRIHQWLLDLLGGQS